MKSCQAQVAFAVGAGIPTLAMLLPTHNARFWGNIGATSFGLILFGVLGAFIGKFSVWRGSMRVILGGWMAIAITYGIGRAFNTPVSG